MRRRHTMTVLYMAALTLTGCVRLPEAEPDAAALRAAYQTALDEAAAEALATSPTMHLALTLALERNPALAAARRRWQAAIERLPQAAALEDPMLDGTLELTEPMYDRAWSLAISQRIPWWRKPWARERVAAAEAAIAAVAWQTAARDLLIDVKDACYELYYIDQASRITADIERLLRDQGLLAYGQIETGRAQLSEAFRAEAQAAQLAYDRLLLAEQRAAQAERLHALLNLPPGTVIGPMREAPVYVMETDVEALFARAEEHAQMLRMRGLEVERAQYEAYLARLAGVPDLALGWMQEANAAAMMGEAMRSAMAGANLPIWQQRYRALVRERDALVEATRLDALDALNEVRRAVAQAYFEARLTQQLIELYDTTFLPQAGGIMRQAELLFRADEGSLSGALETTIAFHNFLLARERAVADHGQALGRLERAIGTTAEPQEAGR